MASLLANSTTRVGDVRIRSQNGRPIIEETYGYIVQADSVDESYIDIVSTDGLPKINISSSAGGLAICQSIKAKRRENAALLWDVTCDFASDVSEGASDTGESDGPGSSDPTAWIPVYETKFERVQEIVAEDASGNAVVNSAGQPFEQGLTRSRFLPIWEFFQFEPISVSDEDIIDRNETVNSGTFKGRGAKTLLLTVERSTVGFFYGQRRRLTKYSLKYNSADWRVKRLDVGTGYKDGANFVEFDPVRLGALDGAGGAQTVGTDPATLYFDVFDTSSFSFLRI
jgi:hypothetical protein